MCVPILQQGFLRRGFGVRRVAIAGCNSLGRQTKEISWTNPLSVIPSLVFTTIEAKLVMLRTNQRKWNASADAIEELGLDVDLSTLVYASRESENDTVLVTMPMRA
jgi:putative colanic acid biosynthesis UDP-glucose lipid carrier transferase